MNRTCACGRPLSRRATTCRWCRPYPSRDPVVRFWDHVQKSDGCWEWTTPGRGRFRVGGRGSVSVQATHFSWELHNGPIPAGLLVCHHCDNPPCVRPDHLFLGTAVDNNADRDAKGRTASGDRWYAARPWAQRKSA